MKNIYIKNASAGSGKTYTLAEEIAEIVNAGIEPERLVVTTFTKKAASELRERVRQRLLKDKNADAAHRVKDGYIGTVNSVCARILQEYAIEAGESPALDVLPEEDQKRIFKISISDAILRHTQKIDGAAYRCSQKEQPTSHSKGSNWTNDVEKIVGLARYNRLGPDELRACAENSWLGLSEMFNAEPRDGMNAQLSMALESGIRELELKKANGGLNGVQETGLGLALDLLEELKSPEICKWGSWVGFYNTVGAPGPLGREVFPEAVEIAGQLFAHKDFRDDVHNLISGVFNCAADAVEQYRGYKKIHAMMDFADQEIGVLKLMEKNPGFRKIFSERTDSIYVDEFQDTNPVQLALFTEFAKHSKKSIWVGDPKQAIFGFRGTDARLMESVRKAIPEGNIQDPLSESWRSTQEIIDFNNAVFGRTFHWVPENEVCLTMPDQRVEDIIGGWVETWNLPKNKQDSARGIAEGIKDMVERSGGDIKYGQIAVLCRTNKFCEQVASELEDIGVMATAEQGLIMEMPECQLAIAALRFMNDQNDTVALADIVSLSPVHGSRGTWLPDLMQAEEPNDCLAVWKTDPLIQGLMDSAEGIETNDPLGALEEAIDRIGLVKAVNIWTIGDHGKVNPRHRMGNLDKLRQACSEYLEYCQARKSAATIAGFVSHINEAETKQAQGVGDDAVQVLSYHKAKGLEWPIVINAEMDTIYPGSAFGIAVESIDAFKVDDPLAGRWIRYWPWPFGGKKKYSDLTDRLAGRPEHQNAVEEELEEDKRLLYVGMTRPRTGLVIACSMKANEEEFLSSWLNELVDENGATVLNLPLQQGAHVLEIGDAGIPINTYRYGWGETLKTITKQVDDIVFLPKVRIRPEYPAAKFAASTVEDAPLVKSAKVTQVGSLKARLMVNGRYESADIGDAVHAYLGVNTLGRTINEKVEIARRCLVNYGLELNIKLDGLVAIGEQLEEFIEATYPGAEVMCEWPVTYRNEMGQYMEGPIDMLLETPDGYVIIDHKTYGGNSPEKRAKKYAPQMNAYKEAVEAATGKPVIATLIHMPVIGAIYSLEG